MDSKELKAYYVICERCFNKIKNRNRNIIILFDYNGEKFRSDFAFLERSFPSREMVLRPYFINDSLIYGTSLKPVSFEEITLTEEQNALYLNKIIKFIKMGKSKDALTILNSLYLDQKSIMKLQTKKALLIVFQCDHPKQSRMAREDLDIWKDECRYTMKAKGYSLDFKYKNMNNDSVEYRENIIKEESTKYDKVIFETYLD